MVAPTEENKEVVKKVLMNLEKGLKNFSTKVKNIPTLRQKASQFQSVYQELKEEILNSFNLTDPAQIRQVAHDLKRKINQVYTDTEKVMDKVVDPAKEKVELDAERLVKRNNISVVIQFLISLVVLGFITSQMKGIYRSIQVKLAAEELNILSQKLRKLLGEFKV